MHAVSIEKLLFSWSGQQPTLDIPAWQIKQGETVLLRGPSGSGKSTLLSLLAGINTPQSGSLNLFETAFSNLSGRQRDRYRADNIGYIFQQFNLLPYLSALDNALLACQFSKKRRQRIAEQGSSAEATANEMLQRLGLNSAQIEQPAHTLSVGQQQRVAAARALLGAPKLLIADEPTSALDAEHRDTFIQLLLELSSQNNTTVIFVTHDAALSSYFDKHVELNELNQAGAQP
ncbi:MULTISPECIES: ABC transporter ATP-binding protein [Idiomarina]|jgi:putative ABC transport system ATP-binding protein|uniref:ABC transporter ATP-binding protein n=1 Tax=Idiomarina TaxID=135575 RepID=UPI001C9475EF|nr:ABC transporter ATP-binding protein [Idiomarina abyssalis]MDA6066630.1 ABC transporter ATP-binding protein [Idiomarina abyssalis]QZN90613.1 ABC transporter ATP-binding protein [Idiomarina abyssalis]|tara:strand:- start:3220 stop:3915 length:696 start_codon:yes stop_codon:yes gene_type:complete